MTAREFISGLSKLTDTELDLPLIAIHGASGVSYEVYTYGGIAEANEKNEAGPLCDMIGQKYIDVSLD